MRRRSRLLAPVLLTALLCGGCAQLRSIGHNAVVLGVALDAAPGGGVTATLQMYHNGGPTGQVGGGAGGTAGGGGSSPGKPIVMDLQGSGQDFAQAVEAGQEQVGVRIGFWATDLVLVGDTLARAGLRAPLDGLLRDGDFSLRAQVGVVEGQAGALLKAPEPGGSALEIGDRLVHSGGTDTGSIPIPFWRFMSRLATPYNAAWAPALARTAQGYRAAGTAVFRGDVLAGVLGVRRTGALSWLLQSGAFKPLTFREPEDGRTVTLDVVSRHKHLALEGTDAGTITLTLVTRIRQAPQTSLRAQGTTGLERAASLAATQELRAALNSLQAAGSDVIGFGELERQRDLAAVADWPTRFARMHLWLDVTVRILAGGRLA